MSKNDYNNNDATLVMLIIGGILWLIGFYISGGQWGSPEPPFYF